MPVAEGGVVRGSLCLPVLLVMCTSWWGAAQDPLSAAPDHFKLLFENAQVRILELRVKPGEKVPLHSHPARVTYVLSSSTFKTTLADGTEKTEQRPIGSVKWADAIAPHTHENLGPSEYRLLICYPKPFLPSGRLTAATALPPEPSSRPVDPRASVRAALLEVDLPDSSGRILRMWKTEIPPGVTTPRHTHPGQVVGYVLEGTLIHSVEGKKPVDLSPGMTWYEAETDLHWGQNPSGSFPLKILGIQVTEKGRPEVLPEPSAKGSEAPAFRR